VSSWLRESVDKVLADAPHMSDAHKRKLVEAVGLELARAYRKGLDVTVRDLLHLPLDCRYGETMSEIEARYREKLCESEERALARARFEQRRSHKKRTD
jgi:hypothetical protein